MNSFFKVLSLSIVIGLFSFTSVNGQTEHSVSFDRSNNQFITVGHNAALNVAGGNFTLEAWVYPTLGGDNAGYTVLSKLASGQEFLFRLGDEDGIGGTTNSRISIYTTSDGSTSSSAKSNTDITLNTWSHVAVAVDVTSGAYTFYLNGVADGNGTLANRGYGSGTGDLYIGDQPGAAFDGSIDEVRIWNDLRTGTEIAENYQHSIDPSAETNLVSYYKANTGSGTTLVDSKSGLDGTFAATTQAPTWSTDEPILPSFVSAEATTTTNIAVTFSENISNVNAFGDFTSADFTATAAGISGAIVNLTVNALASDFSSLDLDIAAGAVSDGAANSNVIVTNETITDGIVPEVTSIVRQSPTDGTTNATGVTFRVTFDEPVVNVDATDFAIAAGGATGTIGTVVANSTTEYDVPITTVAEAGTGVLNLDFGTHNIDDAAGNDFGGVINSEESYTIDQTAPEVTSIVRQSPTDATTNATSVTFRVTFDEPVVNVDATDFAIAAGGATGTIGTVVANSTTEYDVPITTVAEAGTGVLNLDFGTHNIDDAIGNDFGGVINSEESYTIDQTAPEVTSIVRQSPTDATTNATSVTFRVTFDEPVVNVDATDFAIAAGGATGTIGTVVANSTTEYDVPITTVAEAGTNVLNLDFGTDNIDDAAGNDFGGVINSEQEYLIDQTAPEVTSIVRQSPTDATTNATSVTFRVTFDEPVVNVDATDFAIAAGGATGTIGTVVANSTTEYDVPITTVAEAGTGVLNLDFGTHNIDDAAGNDFGGVINSEESYTIDQTAPEVTSIVRQSPTDATTNATSVTFRVTFDEPVVNVDATDFAIAAGGATGTIGTVVANSTTEYDVPITTVAEAGTGVLNLDFGTHNIDDAIGNDFGGVINSEESYTIDQTAPEVTSIVRQSPTDATTNATSVTFRITFDEPVVNVDATDFAIAAGGATGTIGTVVANSTTEYDVPITTVAEAGTNVLNLDFGTDNIDDAAGNDFGGVINSEQEYLIDQTAPEVTSIVRQSPTDATTNATSVTFRVTFDEPVVNVDATDFAIAAGGATGTIGTVVANSTTEYDVPITTVAEAGTGVLNLDFGTHNIDDAAGNDFGGVINSEESYTIDQTAPEVTSIVRQSPTDATTNATSVTFRVTFDEPVVNVDATDFAIAAGGATGTIGTVVANSTTEYDVPITTVAEAGTGVLNLDFGTHNIDDAIGNDFGGVINSEESYTIDQTAPEVTSIVRQSPTDATTNATSVTFRVTFDEPVVNVDATDFAIAAGGATGTIGTVVANSTTEYDVPITTVAEAGTNVLNLDFGTDNIDDAAGNDFGGVINSEQEYLIDQTAPTVSDLEIFDTDDDGFVDQINITFSENIDTDNGNAPVHADLGTLTLPDNSQVTNSGGLLISDPAGVSNVVSVTAIPITDHTSEIANTAVGSLDIDALTGLWEDNAGNAILAVGDDSETLTDSADPVLISSAPADEAASFPEDSDLTFNFSETVQANTGNFTLDDVGDNSDDRVIAIGNGQIVFSTNTMTVNPTGDLENGESYEILIDGTAIEDIANNTYAGLVTTELNFVTGAFAPPACVSPTTYNTTGTDINVFDSECNNESMTFSSLIDSDAEKVAVFYFNIKNGSTSAETLSEIRINNGNTNINWSTVIAAAELYDEDGGVEIADQINASDIRFQTIATGNGDFGRLDPTGTKPNGIEYALYIYFNTNTDLADLDGEHLVFGVDNTSFPGSSGFSGSGVNGGSASSGAGNNEVTVVATEYAFVQQPSDVNATAVMTPVVTLEAIDVNGNRDLDYDNVADAVQLTSSGSLSPLYATPSVANASDWSNGVGTISDIVHIPPTGTYTLTTASGALTDGQVSTTFDVLADATPPTFVNAHFFDTDGNGQIDEIAVEMSEDIDEGSVDHTEFSVGGTGSSIDAFVLSASANNSLDATDNDQYFTLQVTVAGTTDQTFGYTQGTLDDNAGNLAATNASINTNDLAAPVFLNAIFTDVDPVDGTIDEVMIEMSEAVDDDNINPAEFLINGVIPTLDVSTANTFDPDVVDDENFTLAVSLSGTETATVSYTAGSLTDNSSNTNAAATNAAINENDQASPFIINSLSIDRDTDGNTDAVELEFSESIKDITFSLSIADWEVSSDNFVSTNQDDAVTFSSTVTTLAADADFDDEYVSLRWTPTNTSGTSTYHVNYTNGGDDITDNSSNANAIADIANYAITDGALPVFLSARTNDNDDNGQIDQIIVRFSDPIDFAGGTSDVEISDFSLSGGYVISTITDGAGGTSDDDELILNIGERGIDTDATPDVTLLATQVYDVDGNDVTGNTLTALDRANPVFLSSTTMDTDANGQIDQITVLFSEDVDASTIDVSGADDFSVVGYAISAASAASNQVVLTLTESGSNDTGAVPNVTVNASQVDDPVGNTAVTAVIAAIDGAPIKITDATWNDVNTVDGNIDQVILTFSEAVDISDGDGGDGFDAISINSGAITIDNADYAANASTTLTLNFDDVAPISGTGISGLTIDYVLAGANNIIEDGASANEIADGESPLSYSDNATPVATAVTMASNNVTNTDRAVTGNTVTLSFTIDDDFTSDPTVTFNSGGAVIEGSVTVNNASAPNYTATYDVAATDEDGSVTFSLDFTDAAGNGPVSTTTLTSGSAVTVDNTAPTVTITRNAVTNGSFTGTNDNNVSFDIAFSEVIENGDFTIADDITITSAATIGGSTLTPDGDNQNYTLNLTGITGDGDITITLLNGGASPITDAAGNAMSADEGPSDSFTIDNTVPTVTLTRNAVSSGSLTGTNDNNVSFDISFSEAVVDGDFTIADDITITSGATIGGSSLVNDGDNQNYTLNLTGITGDGDITITVLSAGTSALSDLAGNAMSADEGPSDAITIDNTAPTATALTIASNNVTNTTEAITANTITLSITVDDDLTGDPSATFTSGGAAIDNGVTVNDLGGMMYSITYVVDALDTEGDVDFSLTFTDDAGNVIASSLDNTDLTAGGTVVVDNTVPTVTITRNGVTNGSFTGTNDNNVSFDIAFSEVIVNGDFTIADDITITSAATIGGSTLTPDGDNQNYTLNLTGITGDGDITITLLNGGASPITDAAGNAMSADEGPSDSFTIDNTVPTVTLTRNAVSSGSLTGTNDNNVSFDISFSEAVVDGDFTIADDITITSGATIGGSSLVNDGDNQNYTLNLTGITGDGDITITVLSAGTSALSDLAGNAMSADEGPSDAITIDNTPPTAPNVTLLSNGSTGARIGDPVTLTFDVDDDLSGTPVVTFKSGGGFVNEPISIGPDASQGGHPFYIAEYTVSALDNDGTVTFTIDFTDDAGNSTTQINSVVGSGSASGVTVDAVAPTLVITRNTPGAGTVDNTNSTSVSFDLAFSEIMGTGFDFNDITLNLSGVSATTLAAGNLVDDGGGDYTLTVNGVSGDGTVGITVSGTGSPDPAGNTLASDETSSLFTIDNTTPTVTLTRNSVSNGSFTGTSDASISFDIAYSTVIDNSTFDVSDVTLNNPGGVVIGTAVLTADGDNQNYTYTVPITSGDGDLSITLAAGVITDAATNGLNPAVTSSTISIDNADPTLSNVTIVSDNGTNTDKAITGDVVSLTFTVDDDLTGTPTVTFRSGGANVNEAVAVGVDVAHPDYIATYDVSALDNDGGVTFTINFTDDAGNVGTQVSAVSGTGAGTSVTVDNTAPTVSITRNAVTNGSFTGTNDASVSYDISFSEDIDNDASEFTIADDVTVNSTGLTVTSGLTEDVASSDYTLTFSSISGDGDLSFDLINSGGTPVTDLAGNVLSSTVVSDIITIDNTEPTVVITRNAVSNGSLTGTSDASISFDIAYSTVIDNSTFDVSDVTLNNPGGVVIGTAVLTADGDNQNYTYTVPITSGDGDLSITLAAGVIADAATNGLNPSVTSSTITIDNTVPTLSNVTIESDNGTNTDKAITGDVVSLKFTVDDDLTGTPTVTFRSGGANINEAVAVGVDVAHPDYIATYTVSSLDNDGDVTFTISFTDDAGNGGAQVSAVSGTGAGTSVTVDNTAPTVSITRNVVTNGSFTGTNDASVSYDISFSEDIDNDASEFTIADDLTVNSTGLTVTSGLTEDVASSDYTLTFSSISGDGDLSFDLINSGGTPVTDLAGNVLSSTVVSDIITIDNTTPTVTLTRNSVTNGSFTGTNDASISFDIAFSTEINNSSFDVGDVTLNNPGGVVTGTAVLSADGDNQNYTYTLPITSGDGDLSITLATGVIADAATNGLNPAATSSTITIDNTAPTLSNVTIISDNVTNKERRAFTDDVVTLSFSVDDDLTGIPTVTFRSGGANINNAVSVGVDGAHPNYIASYTVSSLDNDGNVSFTIDFTDDAGNPGNQVTAVDDGSSITVDNTSPTLSITRNTPGAGTVDNTNSTSVSFELTFSEAMDERFDINDINLNLVGVTADALIDADLTTADSVVYTLNVNNISGDGTLGITVSGTGTPDLAGNTLAGDEISNLFTIDNTDPTVTITRNSVSNGTFTSTSDASISYDIAFSTVIDNGTFDVNDVTLNNPGGVVTDVITLSADGDNQNYTYTVPITSGDGDLSITLAAGVISDAATNGLNPAVTSGTITIDNTAPELDALTIASGTAPTDHAMLGEEITLTMNFDDDLATTPSVSFRSGSVPINGTVTYTETSDFVADGDEIWTAVYTVDASDFDGSVDFTLTFTDDAGNSGATANNTDLSSGTTVEIDKVKPTVTFSDSMEEPSNTDPIVVTATFDEAVTGLVDSDLTVVNGVVSSVSGSGAVYTINITPDNPLDDNVSITLNASSVIDDAGNANDVSAVYTVDYDNIAPVITASAIVQGRDVTLTAQLDEPGTIYYVVVADGVVISDSTDVLNLSGPAASPIASGSISFTTGGINIVENITLDADRTNYDLYLVSEDNVDTKNLSAISVSNTLDIQSGGVTLNTPSVVDICLEGNFFEIPNILITETIATDFNRATSNRTLILELPDNFVFNNAVGNVSANVGDISSASLTYNSARTSLTITYAISGEVNMDVLTIEGLEVMALGGTTVSNAEVRRTGGNGDIYGINDENDNIPSFALLTTIAPFDAPSIVLNAPSSVTNPYILETDSLILGDVLGDGVTVYDKADFDETSTPITIGTVNASDVIVFYTNEDLTDSLTSLTGQTTYSPSLADLGLTNADVDLNVGVNTFWITTTDGNSCESAATPYSIAIIRTSNSASTTTFSNSDQDGSIFRFSNPSGSSVIITGDGLASFITDDPFPDTNEDGYSVKYLPTTAGPGRDTLKYALTNGSGETANYWIALLVNSTDRVFEDATVGNAGLCTDIEKLDFLAVAVPDVDYDGNETGSNPDFYELRFFQYEDDLRGADITTDVLSASPSIAVNVPTDSAGWELDLAMIRDSIMTADQYSLRLEAAMYTTDENTGTISELSSEVFTVFRNPTVTFQNISDGSFYCEDDEGLNLEVEIISAAGTIVRDIDDNGYELYKLDNDGITYNPVLDSDTVTLAGFSSARLNFQDLNANGDSTENETGQYRVIYSSANYTLASCASTIEASFTLLAKPDRKLLNLANNTIEDHGVYDASTHTYTFEYCEGDTFDALDVSLSANQKILWYRNEGLTNSIETADATGASITNGELFGTGIVAQGGENVSFYYVFVDNTNNDGGCQSDPIEVNYKAYRIPDIPVVDASVDDSMGVEGSNVFAAGTNRFEFNYCVDGENAGAATIHFVELDTAENLTNPATKDYYILYNSTQEDTLDIIRSQSYDLAPHVNGGSPAIAGTSETFYISRVENDSTHFGSNMVEFQGCTSSGFVEIIVNVFDTPSNPVITEFTDNPTDVSGVITYYMCQGDDLPDISINPSDEIAANEYLYEWFADAGENRSIAIKDRQGDLVVENDLDSADLISSNTGFKFSRDSAGTYSMWVKVSSNVRDDASFVGCPSGLSQVNLVVFPVAETPDISPDTGSPNYLSDNTVAFGGEMVDTYFYCVDEIDGLLGANTFNTNINIEVDSTGSNTVNWYLANDSFDGLLSSNAIATGASQTAAGLLISEQTSDTTNFAVIHTKNIIGTNGDNFAGCFADTTYFRVVVGTIPDTEFAFDGIVEGLPTTFKFYDDNNTPVRENGVKIVIRNEAGDTLTSDSVSTVMDTFDYTFAESGDYDVTASLETEIGCEASVTRRIRILDRVTNMPYSQNFETLTKDPWFAEYQTSNGREGSINDPVRPSSWELGVPAEGRKITRQSNGPTSWVTNLDGEYLSAEESFVYSPSFDISSLENPVVSFNSIYNLDSKDGVVFQYSLDGGITWLNIGSFETDGSSEEGVSSGVEWYNAINITGSPGRTGVNTVDSTNFNVPRYGWSDSEVTPLWKESIHSLVFPNGSDLTNLRFRFALGAIDAAKNTEGFGFDDFRIFQLGKTVLVEQFSSVLNPNSPASLAAIQNQIDFDNVMYINYITDFSNDSGRGELNLRNPSDPSARAEYYEVSDDLTSVIDGEVFARQDDPIGWNASSVNLKSLRPVLFNIEDESGDKTNGITYSVTDNEITANARFAYQDSVSAELDLSFYFAVVERKIIVSELEDPGDFDSSDTLYNVLRVMNPSGAGYNWSGVVNPDTAFVYSMKWKASKFYNVNIGSDPNVRIIAFVQNQVNISPEDPTDQDYTGRVQKNVLQSAFVDVLGLTGNVLGSNPISNFSIYPNPGDEEVTIEFDEVTRSEGEWIIYDQTGREVLKGIAGIGTKQLTVVTKEIPSGIYLFHMYGEDNSRYAKRLIIVH